VTAALHEQLDKLAYAHTGFFTTEVAEKLADRLIADAPAGISQRLSGERRIGSDRRPALKMARQLFHRARPARCAATSSPGARAITAIRWARWRPAATNGGARPSRRLLIETHHIDPCFAYRFPGAGRDGGSLRRNAPPQRWETKIDALGAGTVMAFVVETVVGATAGAVPPAKGYFKRIREICDRHGVLLILDEVMCGMGRTGTLHACEQEGIAPDLMTIAKGLGAATSRSARCCSAGTSTTLVRRWQRLLPARHTYMGHPLACAAGLRCRRRSGATTF